MIIFNTYANLSYYELLLEWLNSRKKIIKDSSIDKYNSLIEVNIKPILGNVKYKKLKPEHIYNFFNNENIVNLSDSSKKLLYIVINSSINYGIERKYRKEFGTLNIKIKSPKTRIVYLTQKEQNILEEYLNNNLNLRNLSILFDLYTGLRIGELCALQWKDIDFINNTVTITKTVKRVKNEDDNLKTKTKLILDSPKTTNSTRTIPLPLFLVKILKKFKDNDEYFIFTNSYKIKDPRSLEKYFTNVLKKCNIKYQVFHSLRHTYATRSRESGMDIKILSELLGHSSYKVTLDIYVHTSIDFKHDSVKSLVKYLKPKKFVEL